MQPVGDPSSRWEKELEFALEAARAAGSSTLELFQTDALGMQWKGDGTPVTLADARAERILRERIEAAWPGDGILGEEEGATEGTTGRRWVLDPIDGTVSFIHGVPLYGTLVALEAEDEAVVGVAHFPALDETVIAARGAGTHWLRAGRSNQKGRVSTVSSVADALLCITPFPTDEIMQRPDPGRDRLMESVRKIRGWSDCYAHLLIATGRADLCFEPEMSPWDCGPFPPILEEASGTFTDLDGNRTIHGGNALATNGTLLAETLRILGRSD